jgi:hypothetical protein
MVDLETAISRKIAVDSNDAVTVEARISELEVSSERCSNALDISLFLSMKLQSSPS